MGVTYIGLMMTSSTEEVFQKKEQPRQISTWKRKLGIKVVLLEMTEKRGIFRQGSI